MNGPVPACPDGAIAFLCDTLDKLAGLVGSEREGAALVRDLGNAGED